MITYINDSNRQDYTVLFDKASTKVGLLPIVIEERDPITLETVKRYKKNVYNPATQKWETVDCETGVGQNGEVIQYEVDDQGYLLEVERDSNNNIVLENGKPKVLKTIKPISSLNDYFQHIKDLAGLAIGQGRSGSDPYFLRLPLDEPFLEINANTRGITVPGELSQIAVVGDKLAEIVFFRIDRYYDAVDLNTRHIYIEWEVPDGNGGVTKGISRDFLRDTQSEKDKIIFGWLIDDKLTKNPGTIKFAVRFVEWFDNEAVNQANRREALDVATNGTQMLYSFSSLPATISVVSSLNYSLFEDDEALSIYSQQTEENIGTMVLYLEDSDPDSATESAVVEISAAPNFVRDLAAPFYGTANLPAGEIYNKVNLENGKLRLQVEAFAEDGGQISYIFGRIAHKENEGTGTAKTGATGMVAKIDFIEAENVFGDVALADVVASSTFNTNKTFFMKNASGTFYVVTENDIRAAIEEAKVHDSAMPQIFEKVAYVEVQQPGHYYAIADNRAGGKKVNSTHSSSLYIPWATQPVIKDNKALPTRFVFDERAYVIAANTDLVETGLAIVQDPEHQLPIGNTNVFVSSAPMQNAASSITLAPVFETKEESTLSYRWYYNANTHLNPTAERYARPEGTYTDEAWAAREAQIFEDDGWELIEGATEASYTVNKADPKAAGYYAVVAYHDFNNSYKASDLGTAGFARLTKMPEVPTLNWTKFENDKNALLANPTAGQPFIINLEVDLNGIDYDEIKYQWHKITEGEGTNLSDVENATSEDVYTPAGTLVFNEEGKAIIPFQPILTGSYYLEIRNTLNGATVIYNAANGESAYGTVTIR